MIVVEVKVKEEDVDECPVYDLGEGKKKKWGITDLGHMGSTQGRPRVTAIMEETGRFSLILVSSSQGFLILTVSPLLTRMALGLIMATRPIVTIALWLREGFSLAQGQVHRNRLRLVKL
ncbi:hypothetical protein SUGI_0017760 [Cryptomeria japonica]|nr:hypothetical protein SUGI_0017760 [Cryptomeria japonica]